MIDSLELTNFQPLADSQGQNFDPGSRLPGSIFLLWESAPRVKILTLGVGSQSQNFDLGSRLLGSFLTPGSLHVESRYCNISANFQDMFYPNIQSMFSFSWEGFSNKRQIYWNFRFTVQVSHKRGNQIVLYTTQVLDRYYHPASQRRSRIQGVLKKEHSSEFEHKFCRPSPTTHPPI